MSSLKENINRERFESRDMHWLYWKKMMEKIHFIYYVQL